MNTHDIAIGCAILGAIATVVWMFIARSFLKEWRKRNGSRG